jgi:hypothetical protein
LVNNKRVNRLVRRVRGDKSPLPPCRNLQRSQPAVYQLHLVQDLQFSKKGVRKEASEVTSGNILRNSRSKKISWDLVGIDRPLPEPAERKMRKRKYSGGKSDNEVNDRVSFMKGDRVKIRTKMFGALYAQCRNIS